ncbi:MAG: hypothetical protein H6767_01230 [Candidatus Peribacteria bacterium]|nr:MAG: hypothetical protein H6767_01230 [Candidatus Peribacteria bacterium]
MMEGLLFFRLEIILFFTSLGYIFYYLGEKIYHAYFHVKKMVTPIVVEEKEHQKKIRLSGKEENYKKDRGVATKLTDKKLKRLIEIHKRVKMNASKGYIDTAKALIVEGLAIDKFHKELNIELANIYEKEKNYIKSEYIYRDLIDVLEDDFEILKRLGFSLAMQKKYFEAISIYKKAYKKHRADFEIVDILTNLNFEIEDYK